MLDEAQCRHIGAPTVQGGSGTLQLQSSAFASSANSIIAQKFGGSTLIREWRRIGTAGGRKIELHGRDGSAIGALDMEALDMAAPKAKAGLRHGS